MALFQTVVLARISLWGAQLDLMLLLVLMWAMVRGTDEGLVFAFVGGLILDLFSGGPLGTIALALLAVALLAGQPWGSGIGSPVMRIILLTLLAATVYHVVMLIVLAWTGHVVDWGGVLPRVVGPAALLNAAVAPFVHRPLEWLERRTRRERSFAL